MLGFLVNRANKVPQLQKEFLVKKRQEREKNDRSIYFIKKNFIVETFKLSIVFENSETTHNGQWIFTFIIGSRGIGLLRCLWTYHCKLN